MPTATATSPSPTASTPSLLRTLSQKSRTSLRLLKRFPLSTTGGVRQSIDDRAPQHPVIPTTAPLPTLQKGLGNAISQTTSMTIPAQNSVDNGPRTHTRPICSCMNKNGKKVKRSVTFAIPQTPCTKPQPPHTTVGSSAPRDPTTDIGPMPRTWSAEHDRAICALFVSPHTSSSAFFLT